MISSDDKLIDGCGFNGFMDLCMIFIIHMHYLQVSKALTKWHPPVVNLLFFRNCWNIASKLVLHQNWIVYINQVIEITLVTGICTKWPVILTADRVHLAQDVIVQCTKNSRAVMAHVFSHWEFCGSFYCLLVCYMPLISVEIPFLVHFSMFPM